MLFFRSTVQPFQHDIVVDFAEAALGQIAVDLQADLRDFFEQPRIRRPGIDFQHQHRCRPWLFAIFFQRVAVGADKIVGIFDDHHPPPAAEHRDGSQIIEHFAQFDFVAVECRERHFRIVAGEHSGPQPIERFTLQERLVAKQHADGGNRRRFVAREKIESRCGIGHAAEYIAHLAELNTR